MITIDVCMETVFEKVPFLERPAKIAKAGFTTVELWFPELHLGNYDCRPLRKACDAAGVKVNNLVVNSPDGVIGGALTDPQDRERYLERLPVSLECCHQLGAEMLITCAGNQQPGLQPHVQRHTLIETLRLAGELADRAGVTLVLEALNSRVDHHGYFLDDPEGAADIIRAVRHPRVGLLFDIYHMQIMRGNLLDTIRENLDVIRHFHAAGVPGRHELDRGELDYPRILATLNDMGYSGCFGLEYFPAEADAASLRRMRRLLPDVTEPQQAGKRS